MFIDLRGLSLDEFKRIWRLIRFVEDMQYSLEVKSRMKDKN